MRTQSGPGLPPPDPNGHVLKGPKPVPRPPPPPPPPDANGQKRKGSKPPPPPQPPKPPVPKPHPPPEPSKEEKSIYLQKGSNGGPKTDPPPDPGSRMFSKSLQTANEHNVARGWKTPEEQQATSRKHQLPAQAMAAITSLSLQFTSSALSQFAGHRFQLRKRSPNHATASGHFILVGF